MGYGGAMSQAVNAVMTDVQPTEQQESSTATQEESKQSTAVSRSAVKSQQGQTARNNAMSGSILTSPVQSSANQGQKTLLGQ